MMVVPVDPDEHEAQDVNKQRREPAAQVGEAAADRSPQFEGHDRDDHGEHAVAEGLQPAGLGLGVTKYHRHSLTVANDSTPGSRDPPARPVPGSAGLTRSRLRGAASARLRPPNPAPVPPA